MHLSMAGADPIRVAYLCDGLFPQVIGGMAKFATRLAEEFVQKGAHVTIFTPLHKDLPDLPGAASTSALLPANQLRSVPWGSLPPFPGHYVVENFLFSRRLSPFLNRDAFDVVYAHGFTAWHYLRTGAGPTLPVVVNLHGLEPFQDSGALAN